MSKYNIPTPKQVDFYNTKEFDEIMELIIKAINNRQFEFVPRQNWSNHFDQIRQELSEHWNLKSEWSGQREDGYSIWKITPKK